jgi:CRP/FNR family cyclic AMP-dependent transcriptional regulator
MSTHADSPQPSRPVSFLNQLPAALLDRLTEIGSSHLYEGGQIIQFRGDMRHGLSIIESGALRMGTTSADGRFLSTVILRQGESYGELTLFARLPRALDAETIGPTRINFVSREAFTRILDGAPDLRDIVLSNLATQLARALEQIDSLLRLPLHAQIARLLNEYAITAPDQPPIKIAVTHAQLAASLGVTRVSIASALDRLVATGLITKGYGSIEICDLPAMRSWLADQSDIESLFE